jgi:hypothetical protein
MFVIRMAFDIDYVNVLSTTKTLKVPYCWMLPVVDFDQLPVPG